MEATIFTGWIYDHLQPHAAALKVAHPLMLRAIAAAKKKNDRIDARKICDCLRCDFLPECYMASTAIRERRRMLRYRNLLVRQMVQMGIWKSLPTQCPQNFTFDSPFPQRAPNARHPD
jgi:transposase